MHSEQFNFPTDFMQLIGLPCHRILIFHILLSSSFVGFSPLVQCFAKCFAKESDLMSLTDWQDLHSLTYLHYCLAVCQLTLYWLYCLLPWSAYDKRRFCPDVVSLLPSLASSQITPVPICNGNGMCGSCWHESLDLWHRRMEAARILHAPLAALLSLAASRGLIKQAPVWTINLVFSCSSLFYVVPILLYRQLWVFLFMPQTGASSLLWDTSFEFHKIKFCGWER
jgi:hypothetical protein